jgi:hypothetical protein
MRFFKKLFSDKQGSVLESRNAVNKRLVTLLDAWYGDRSTKNSGEVIKELMFGSSELFLPFIDIDQRQHEWESLQTDTLFKLASVIKCNNQKIVFAFADSQLITPWLEKPAVYTSMHSVNMLNACKESSIDKAIIFFGKKKPFVIATAC